MNEIGNKINIGIDALQQINFFKVDWAIITIWIIVLLLILVVFIISWKYWMRWGDVRAENLDYIDEIFSNYTHPLKIHVIEKKEEYISSESQNSVNGEKNVLIFTPNLVSPRRLNFFSGSFAQLDKVSRVFIIDSAQIVRNSTNEEKICNYILQILQDLNINILISFDYSTRFILNSIMNVDSILKRHNALKIEHVYFIRPILVSQKYSFTHMIPFSYRWIFTLLSNIKLSMSKNYQDILDFNEVGYKNLENASFNIHFIFSQYPIGSLEEMKAIGMKNHAITTRKFSKGGFRFHNQETLLLAEILKNL